MLAKGQENSSQQLTGSRQQAEVELRATLIMQRLAEHSQGQTRPHGCVRMGVCAAPTTGLGTKMSEPGHRGLETADCGLWTVDCRLLTVDRAWVMYVRRAANF